MKNKTTETVKTSITLPKYLLDKFKNHCKAERRSVSAQITLFIERELEAIEKAS